MTSSASMDYVEDDEGDDMTHINPSHSSDILASLGTLRRNQKFCDVKLVVENHEIFAHRAVLAASSAAMFDILSKGDDSGPTACCMVKLKDVPFRGFSHLLDYIYTGRMSVPPSEVKDVYKTARRLKLTGPAHACADFLCSTLTNVNCLGIRMCAEDSHFRGKVDEYIQENIGDVTNGINFFSLPRIQLEVIGTDETILTTYSESRLFDLALDWVKASVEETKPKFDRLTEKVNVLYLSADSVLRDCKDIPDNENLNQDMAVQDYKKLVRRQTGVNESSIPIELPVSNDKPLLYTFHKFNIEPESPKQAKEWSVVAGHRVREHTFLCIMMLGRQMATLSLHFRIPQNSPYSSSSDGPDSPVSSRAKSCSFEKLSSFTPFGTMSMPRCAMGIRSVRGKIIACGGYDRGEVMKSAEMYNPETNVWEKILPMWQARCRFTAAHLDGKLYAIAGSDGHNELDHVECYDLDLKKWSPIKSLTCPRASPGVAVLKGKIYCVGGSYGQESLKMCEAYDPETNTWSAIAPLNIGRFQTCVRAFKNRLYAVGGTDGFNVFSTVEVYNPDKDIWEMGPSLNVARRGAGIEAFQGKLYIVGGSDGTQSLKTTECFDPKDQNWTFCPALSIPRANVGAAVIDNRLFAIGGFSGKRFLDTMEYYDVQLSEWYTFEPFTRSRPRTLSNASDSDSVGSSVGAESENKVTSTNNTASVKTDGVKRSIKTDVKTGNVKTDVKTGNVKTDVNGSVKAVVNGSVKTGVNGNASMNGTTSVNGH